MKKADVQPYLDAWKLALPSQVTDSFHQIVSGTQERVLAYKIEASYLENLEVSNGLELHYGYDATSATSDQASFKVFLKVKKSGSQVDDYYDLKPQTYSAIENDLPIEVSNHLLKPLRVETNDANGVQLSDELIPSTIEYWLFYNWLICPTSELIDKVSTLYNGQRLRIEYSVYQSSVSSELNQLYQPSAVQPYETLVLLGLHQVVPGDRRRYHFGPILQSFPVETSGTSASNTYGDPTFIQPVNYELSTPCPPCTGGGG